MQNRVEGAAEQSTVPVTIVIGTLTRLISCVAPTNAYSSLEVEGSTLFKSTSAGGLSSSMLVSIVKLSTIKLSQSYFVLLHCDGVIAVTW